MAVGLVQAARACFTELERGSTLSVGERCLLLSGLGVSARVASERGRKASGCGQGAARGARVPGEAGEASEAGEVGEAGEGKASADACWKEGGSGSTRPSLTTLVTVEDPALARWIHGHHVFFPLIQALLVTHALVLESLQENELARASEALWLSSLLLRASGVAMKLAGDMTPEAYADVVRPAMPEGFSGLMSADHAALMKLVRGLKRCTDDPPHALRAPLRAYRLAVGAAYGAHIHVCAHHVGSHASLRMDQLAGSAASTAPEDLKGYLARYLREAGLNRPVEAGADGGGEREPASMLPDLGLACVAEGGEPASDLVAGRALDVADGPDGLRGEALALSGTWTIHGALASFLATSPAHLDRPALVTDAGSMSFRALSERVTAIARGLRARLRGAPSVEGSPLVGVCMSRSPALVAVLLAVLQVGGAYVPLDPQYPRDRLAYIASDADPALIVTEPRHAACVQEIASSKPCWVLEPELSLGVETAAPCLGAERGVAVDGGVAVEGSVVADGGAMVDGEGLFAVLYTSGSTGHPRGVCLSHRAAQNRFRWMWQARPFAPGEVCCFKTPLGFVDAVWELFGALLQGVTVAVAPDDLEKDPHGLLAFVVRHGVSRLIVVPSLLRLLVPRLADLAAAPDGLPARSRAGIAPSAAGMHPVASVAHFVAPAPRPVGPRIWTCSGEALPADLAAAFLMQRPGDVLLNLYGSTEVMGDVTWHEVRVGDAPVPVGRPIANTTIELLDDAGRPVAPGAIGAVHVRGATLARGHLVPGEGRVAPLGDGQRYTTGDLGRWVRASHDGGWTLVYEGRRDRQVKLLGNRFDLAELEGALASVEGVARAVALLREDPAGVELLGFVQPSAPGSVTLEALRVACQRALPPVAQPTLVLVEALPLLPNGKLDRRALLAQSASGPASKSAASRARSAADRSVIARVWREVLGEGPAGEEVDFFLSGGTSIQAVAMVRRLRDAGVPVSLEQLYAARTPGALRRLRETRRGDEREAGRGAGDEREPGRCAGDLRGLGTSSRTAHAPAWSGGMPEGAVGAWAVRPLEATCPEAREAAVRVLADSFGRADVMALALGATPADFLALSSAAFDATASSGLSFLAVDGAGTPAGCVLAVDLWRLRADVKAGRFTPPPVFGPIFAMFDALEAPWHQRVPVSAPGRWVSVLLLGVTSTAFAGPVTHLLEAAVVEAARVRDYEGLLTVNTSVVTQHLCEELGYREEARMDARAFMLQGARPFAHVPKDATQIVLHERRLGEPSPDAGGHAGAAPAP
ncbi:non-ribosomal peptide synthetase [Chondromyces crocatus]|nr:non-ribosomal peptide synthetase [Chondromyces crocatus]